MSALLYISEPEHSRSLGLGSLAMEAFTQQALWALGSGVCASGRVRNRYEGPGALDSALLGWKAFGPHFLALLPYLGLDPRCLEESALNQVCPSGPGRMGLGSLRTSAFWPWGVNPWGSEAPRYARSCGLRPPGPRKASCPSFQAPLRDLKDWHPFGMGLLTPSPEDFELAWSLEGLEHCARTGVKAPGGTRRCGLSSPRLGKSFVHIFTTHLACRRMVPGFRSTPPGPRIW